MDHLEVKAAFTTGEAGQIAGYASLFGRPADAVSDIIAAGAFKSSLASGLPKMKAEHDGPDVGVWEEIVEDDMGLRVKGRFDLKSQAGKAAYAAVLSGRKDGLSIGYFATKTAQERDGSRVLLEIDLREISVVREPASSRSRILSVKSAAAGKEGTMPENEQGAAPEMAALQTEVKNLAEAMKGFKPTDVASLESRLAELEKKANRPGGGGDDAKQHEITERKALASLIRSGSTEEIKSVGGTFEMKAAASDNDPAGGYFVLPTVDLTIRALMTDLSPLRGLAEVVSISTDRYERFYSFGKRGAQWVSERDDRPQDTARPELVKHSYGVAELYAAPAATRHLLDDAATDIASWLINNAVHDFAETEGDAFLEGDGIDGRPRGLLTYPTSKEKDFERNWGNYQYVPAGHASAPTDKNLTDAAIRLVASLRKPYKGNACFYMNSNTAVRFRTIVDEIGRYLWAPTGNLIEGVEHPLLGYRVEIDEGMPDIGADAHPVAFGDFRQAYVIVDRQGVRITRDEVTQKGRILFDTYKRVGGGAGDFNALKFLKIAAN
ncbi:phage major capsid protein [Mesorhizobium sp. PUT5]|uniref:phage major capsid protein n=1 Tax=Mesorhizobium sp. PUT5 TaxID=3454629 RepID=UPI003FA4069C